MKWTLITACAIALLGASFASIAQDNPAKDESRSLSDPQVQKDFFNDAWNIIKGFLDIGGNLFTNIFGSLFKDVANCEPDSGTQSGGLFSLLFGEAEVLAPENRPECRNFNERLQQTLAKEEIVQRIQREFVRRAADSEAAESEAIAGDSESEFKKWLLSTADRAARRAGQSFVDDLVSRGLGGVRSWLRGAVKENATTEANATNAGDGKPGLLNNLFEFGVSALSGKTAEEKKTVETEKVDVKGVVSGIGGLLKSLGIGRR